MIKKSITSALRNHFYRATVSRDYTFKEVPTMEAHKPGQPAPALKVDMTLPYQTWIFEELPQPKDAQDMNKLKPKFSEFCDEAATFLESSTNEADKKQVESAFQDWLVLRRACREQHNILNLNRIGVEKDE